MSRITDYGFYFKQHLEHQKQIWSTIFSCNVSRIISLNLVRNVRFRKMKI